jgi:outer membrane protein with beta-barrel domain
VTRRQIAGLALVWIALLLKPAAASAEFQVKPFLGLTFGAATTLVDAAAGSDSRHVAIGVSAIYLGEIFGVEAEVSQVPKFFQRSDADLTLNSVINTVSGSVIVALPRRMSGYSLRPYAVVGFGLLHARTDTAARSAFDVTSNMGAIDLGGGVTGFVSDRIGIGWDLRYFRRVSGGPAPTTGLVFGEPQLSFWRAYMAVVVR